MNNFPVTDKEYFFVKEYVKDYDTKRAAIAAGYSPATDISRVKKRPEVQRAIKETELTIILRSQMSNPQDEKTSTSLNATGQAFVELFVFEYTKAFNPEQAHLYRTKLVDIFTTQKQVKICNKRFKMLIHSPSIQRAIKTIIGGHYCGQPR